MPRRISLTDVLLLGGVGYLYWRHKQGLSDIPQNPFVQVGGTVNLTDGGCGCTGQQQGNGGA